MKDNPNGIGWVGGTTCNCGEVAGHGRKCPTWDIGLDEDGLLETEEEFLSERPIYNTTVSVEVSIPEMKPYSGPYQKALLVTGTRSADEDGAAVVLFLNGSSIRVNARHLVDAVESATGEVYGF